MIELGTEEALEKIAQQALAKPSMEAAVPYTP
jgi:hypothetical protein